MDDYEQPTPATPAAETTPNAATPTNAPAAHEGSKRGRGIILAVVVIIVAAIVGYLVLQNLGYAPKLPINFTSSTTTIPTSTTTVPIGTVSTTTIGSNSSYQGCLSGGTAKIPNGDFATGTYADWNATGGFGTAPLNITTANADQQYYGSPWNGYDYTYFGTTFTGGISVSPGNLTSETFQVTEPYLNFQIVSAESQSLYVEILSNNQSEIRAFYNTFGNNGTSSSTFRNASISLASLLCSNVTVRVVAGVVGSPASHYQFIGAGGFYLSQNPVNDPSILVNQSVSKGS